MSRDEAAIEKEIQDRGANVAPRLTPQLIDESILSVHYMHGAEMEDSLGFPTSKESLGCLTICVLVLKNGFTIVGKSACASPANYNAEIGRKITRDDARNQVWALEGYALRNRLAAE